MYSLNVDIPGEVSRLAGELARELPGARARPRDEHTLVAKRLGAGDRAAFQRFAARVREAVAGTAPFAVRIAGIDAFFEPTAGTGPVVYLAIESPGLMRLHHRLCEALDPVAGLEGAEYTPHVTVARGGSRRDAERLLERDVDPVEWTATELFFWDAGRAVPAGRISLPS